MVIFPEVRTTVKITWASVDYDDSLPIFGAAVIIHLDNTQTIFFSLEEKAVDPAYIALLKGKRLFDVKTDGESIYWPDGPRLSVGEIMEMLNTEASGCG